MVCMAALFTGCASMKKKKIKIPTPEIAKVCSRVDEQKRICECNQQVFSCREDKIIYGCVSLRYVNKVHKVIFEWYAPDNSSYYISDAIDMSQPEMKHEQVMAYQRLDITKLDDLGMTGTWRLTVKLDGEVLSTQTFTIIQ